jgi:aminomethyltransferase
LDPKRTHLYDYHKAHGKLVEFAGFEMPVWFEGVIPEHHAVRNGVGIFDVSHMGRTIVEGPDAERFMNYMITNDVSPLDPMSALYTVMCNLRGGIVDDFITYRLARDRFLVIFNASNREKDFRWFQGHAKGFKVKLKDISDEVAMISVQGPRSPETLQKLCTGVVTDFGRFTLTRTKLCGFDAMAARTGYTGEDGFELFVLDCPLNEPDKALTVWDDLLGAGEGFGIRPCGLGARDSLRLEAGLSLYGNDIDDNINPIEAKLKWVVKLKKPGDFVGKAALLRVVEEGVKKARVGIMMEDRGIPRHGYEIWDDEEKIGVVTSGGYGPTLDVGIALGYVPPEYEELGTSVNIKIRERLAKGKVVKSHPFYDESKYGWKREKG